MTGLLPCSQLIRQELAVLRENDVRHRHCLVKLHFVNQIYRLAYLLCALSPEDVAGALIEGWDVTPWSPVRIAEVFAISRVDCRSISDLQKIANDCVVVRLPAVCQLVGVLADHYPRAFASHESFCPIKCLFAGAIAQAQTRCTVLPLSDIDFAKIFAAKAGRSHVREADGTFPFVYNALCKFACQVLDISEHACVWPLAFDL